MKALPFILALLCASCATKDQVASGEAYRPPVYRTGSNIPTQGSGTTSPEESSASGESVQRALPPRLVTKQPGSGN